jgi:hypothetical protein
MDAQQKQIERRRDESVLSKKIRPRGKKIDEYVLRKALGKQKRLCVGFNKETRENYTLTR